MQIVVRLVELHSERRKDPNSTRAKPKRVEEQQLIRIVNRCERVSPRKKPPYILGILSIHNAFNEVSGTSCQILHASSLKDFIWILFSLLGIFIEIGGLE